MSHTVCALLILNLAFTRTAEITEDSQYGRMSAILFPIVKPELLEEFKSVWKDWFVLEDTIENQKEPGLMKGL